MESQAGETPLKVCPHCAVASRTESDTCPACGKPYTRGGFSLSWRWWMAIPIVLIAFGIGYGGRKLIQGSDNESTPEGITLAQAKAVKSGISRPDLIDELGGQEPGLVKSQTGQKCLVYLITDQKQTLWEFCFKGDKLAVSSTYVPTSSKQGQAPVPPGATPSAPPTQPKSQP